MFVDVYVTPAGTYTKFHQNIYEKKTQYMTPYLDTWK